MESANKIKAMVEKHGEVQWNIHDLAHVFCGNELSTAYESLNAIEAEGYVVKALDRGEYYIEAPVAKSDNTNNDTPNPLRKLVAKHGRLQWSLDDLSETFFNKNRREAFEGINELESEGYFVRFLSRNEVLIERG